MVSSTYYSLPTFFMLPSKTPSKVKNILENYFVMVRGNKKRFEKLLVPDERYYTYTLHIKNGPCPGQSYMQCMATYTTGYTLNIPSFGRHNTVLIL